MIVDMGSYVIELDEHVVHPGCAAVGMGGPWEYSSPAEGPELEYTGARIIRNGRTRELNPDKILEALTRRLGDRWEEDAIAQMEKDNDERPE